MSELRKRLGTGKFADIGPHNDMPNTSACVRLPASLSSFGFARPVILALSLAASAVWFLSSKEPLPLPDSYAVCSHAGPRIYTVDDAVPMVQCLVVNQSFIVDSGSLGMLK
jgi:hypothetical protein